MSKATETAVLQWDRASEDADEDQGEVLEWANAVCDGTFGLALLSSFPRSIFVSVAETPLPSQFLVLQHSLPFSANLVEPHLPSLSFMPISHPVYLCGPNTHSA